MVVESNEQPTEAYGDIGDCNKQIQELTEVVVLPVIHLNKFEATGIKPPKGVFLYGPQRTGNFMLACACTNQTNIVFLGLARSQLVQMFIGDEAKRVSDAFEMAKEKIKEGGVEGATVFVD